MKKLFNILLILLVVVPSVYSQDGPDIWTTTTTVVGRVFGMVINPVNQNIMYTGAGISPGGVYKTTDGGSTWFAVNNGLTNPVVQALGMSKNNPQVLYAGTSPGAIEGVFKTTDGGTNWTQINNGIAEPAGTIGIQAILVHPDNPLIAWCAAFSGAGDAVNGIYKTTDGGANWFVSNNGIGTIKNFLSLAMSPTDPNTLYAGSSFLVTAQTGPSVIYKSTDGGANWFLSSTGLPSATTEINPVRTIQVSTANPNIVVAGLFMNTATGGFYLSTDAGASWTRKHNGLPEDVGTLIRSSAIRPEYTNEFYVGLDRNSSTNIGVWRTTNGGDNWTPFNGGTLLDTYGIRALVFKTGAQPTLYAGCGTVVGAGVYEYTITGLPTSPIFSISPNTKDFGSVYVGHSSANQTFTISNIGGGTLTINTGGISITGTDASQFVLTNTNPYPINLTGGQSVTVDVKFSPTTVGAKTASLQIVDNTTDATHLVPLSGIGVTPPAIPYFADFETFTVGQRVACQDPVNWTTWSNLPCDAVEDAFISSNHAYSGTKSAVIALNNDLVKPLVGQTSGKWHISFMDYIPTGKTGYFNTLALYSGASSEWGMECYFNAGGAGSLNAGGTGSASFTWTADSWKKVEVIVDLDNDIAEFWYGGVMIYTWQWTLGATGGGGSPLQLDANDFYGATANDEMYFDDYNIEQEINTFPLSVNIAQGWNMVSVPGTNPDGMDITHWWINHTGIVYKFVPGSGYSGITTTIPGQGYWEKNTVNQTYNTGDEWPAGGIQLVTHDPINAALGWNMFGGYEDIVDPLALTTVPAGKIVYPIYKFVPGSGYTSTAQIVPGYGYWVKVSAVCQIIVPNVMAKSNQKMAELFKDDLPAYAVKAGWGKIILTDAAGSSYTLYAVKGDSPNGGAGVDLNQYELPPLPPAGLFDVRFGSSRVAEDINTDFKSIEMRGITYPVRIKADGMDIRLMDVSGKLINTNIKDGEEITIDNANIDKVMVSGQLIPDKYSLEQNYPNPFNPSTTIQFSLPENVKNVRISVYNVLGQKVAELVNGEMPAGKYQYQWNAKNFASGMYIYELRTEKFNSVKKMLLLK